MLEIITLVVMGIFALVIILSMIAFVILLTVFGVTLVEWIDSIRKQNKNVKRSKKDK